MAKINASIVLYNNDVNQIEKAISCFLFSELGYKLFLVDNSDSTELEKLKKIDPNRIEYIKTRKNLGYGKAHNIALKKSINDNAQYHIILNPDVSFGKKVIETLYAYMEQVPEIGLLMPRVLYPNGEIQHLCKLLPTPVDLILRRFMPFVGFTEKRNKKYELRFTGYEKIMDVPVLSGCFMFLRISAIKKVGLFDDRFFMYLEDFDLSRRIGQVSRTVYYPEVSIYHEYKKDSYKNLRLLKHHIISAIKYFNKWGWFFDKDRKQINNETLQNLRSNYERNNLSRR
jgi:GT2 family glycosyltransferase